MPTLADALALAKAGWEIGPLRGKAPTTGLTPHGCTDFTRDPDTISEWWAHGAAWNIGGRHPGIVTLDLDPRNAGTLDLLRKVTNGNVPETLMVESGRRDGGVHLHYRHPGIPLTSRRLPAGIDLKTPNGYVTLPPSKHPVTGLEYRWHPREVSSLSPDLLRLLRRTPPKHRTPPASAAASVSGLPAFVAGLPEGNRNSGLFWACCEAARTGVLNALEPDLLAAAERTGLDPREARQVVASARRTEAS